MKTMKAAFLFWTITAVFALGACSNGEQETAEADDQPEAEVEIDIEVETVTPDADVLVRGYPPSGAQLAEGPQSIRLLFSDTPIVERSSIELSGPDGEVELSGLHTMGANDLMILVNDEMPEGDYLVEWYTVLGEEAMEHSGTYDFTISADAPGPEVDEAGLPVDSDAAFIKADPPRDATLTRSPRTLRVYLSQLPNIDNSSLTLIGPDGEEVPLSRFHTMGADDLMIEVDEQPLPNGEYTVQWTARFGDSEREYQGSYQFTVDIPEQE